MCLLLDLHGSLYGYLPILGLVLQQRPHPHYDPNLVLLIGGWRLHHYLALRGGVV